MLACCGDADAAALAPPAVRRLEGLVPKAEQGQRVCGQRKREKRERAHERDKRDRERQTHTERDVVVVVVVRGAGACRSGLGLDARLRTSRMTLVLPVHSNV